MTRKRALSEDRARELVQDYNGWDPHDPGDRRNIAWFATKYGVSESTVMRELREREVPMKARRRPLSHGDSAPPVDVNLFASITDAYLRCNQRVAYLEGLLRSAGIPFV